MLFFYSKTKNGLYDTKNDLFYTKIGLYNTKNSLYDTKNSLNDASIFNQYLKLYVPWYETNRHPNNKLLADYHIQSTS